jgi:hypothetical protein
LLSIKSQIKLPTKHKNICTVIDLKAACDSTGRITNPRDQGLEEKNSTPGQIEKHVGDGEVGNSYYDAKS